MVLIFDLDDTLYEERMYMASGFRAVARWLVTRFHWDPKATYRSMLESVRLHGRDLVFDRVLRSYGKLTKVSVRNCIYVYRHHRPEIQLLPAARDLLRQLEGTPLYLVTDGHKVAQAEKIKALGIGPRFRKLYLTHRYGVRYAKPSPLCFDLIRRGEECHWEDMVYVGDDPAKDFVGLNPLGVHTVRVLTGRHRNTVALPGYEAEYRIANLTQLPGLLKEIYP
jgi:putative hydrolase of the HAD superfamily